MSPAAAVTSSAARKAQLRLRRELLMRLLTDQWRRQQSATLLDIGTATGTDIRCWKTENQRYREDELTANLIGNADMPA